ncbi:MAG: hypothetical protein A3F84_25085 [Candidatus Handelsmanbacteria bacterium RIFCSPLOWO2_12_FULL_64_10]|uniref:DUF3108 domain-containing protein n=1 Tax=Handelsmanbacteria sp. (strain RIFCSPLOWO2_12_FULL_64_10) TaxID=1817868 RepID=A0A1F6CBY8_HANXR|nr:MAG: hypothetical protein A3F84_25085 [Candidatus Handelsmanbacteria bacterium RIFCSPLOWO2_12_FULL_64_10]
MKFPSRKVWRSTLTVVGVLLWGGCVVVPEEDVVKDPDYFPLEIGNIWAYASFDQNGRQLDEPVTYRVVSTSRSGDTVIYYRELSFRTSFQEAFYKDETGVYTVGNTGELLERRVAYPVVLDEEWDFAQPRIVRDSSGRETASYRRRARVVAKENVTLFKGHKFENALKVHYITEGPSRPAEVVRWYAPEVGVVREVRLFVPNTVTELTEYSLVAKKGGK